MSNLVSVLNSMRVVSWDGYHGKGQFTKLSGHDFPVEMRKDLESRWGVSVRDNKKGGLLVFCETPTTYDQWLSQHGNPKNATIAVADTKQHLNYHCERDTLSVVNGILMLESWTAEGIGATDGAFRFTRDYSELK